MGIADSRREWFSMGRVFSRAWMTFGNLAPMSLMTVGLFSVLPEALLGLLAQRTMTAVASMNYINSGAVGIAALGLVVNLIAIVGQTAVTYAALQHQQGRPVTFGASLGVGGQLFLPILGLGILTTFGIGLGIVALVIPGLLVMTQWVVAAPVRIARGPGINDAMAGSAELTKGVRWQVFGLLLVTFAVLFGLSMGHEYIQRFLPRGTIWIVTFILTPAFNAFVVLYIAFGTASLFHELSWGPDAGPADATADVFD